MPSDQTTSSEGVRSRILFGEILRGYRQRVNLSQEKFAQLLGVASSTLSRIEGGGRRAPRAVSFYERLRSIPGITEDDVHTLLSSHDSPYWFIADIESQEEQPEAQLVITYGGYRVNLKIVGSMLGETGDHLQDLLSQVVRVSLKIHLRKRRKMLKILRKYDT